MGTCGLNKVKHTSFLCLLRKNLYTKKEMTEEVASQEAAFSINFCTPTSSSSSQKKCVKLSAKFPRVTIGPAMK